MLPLRTCIRRLRALIASKTSRRLSANAAPPLSDLLFKPGVHNLVSAMHGAGDSIALPTFHQMCRRAGIGSEAIQSLHLTGVFHATRSAIGLTTHGQRLAILLRALHGADDIGSTVQKLEQLYPNLKPYELITTSVTEYVLGSLSLRRDFIRLYLCSPWIRLDQRYWDLLRAAVWTARERYGDVQILVITKPESGYRDKAAWGRTVQEMRQLAAQVVLNDKLHAKLYISEPGPNGGSHYAVFGSENLTGANNVELALKIENNSEILTKLTAFFLATQAQSELLL